MAGVAPKGGAASSSVNNNNVVVIHVCDENRHVTRDFCCKRDILVSHMAYFDKFLTENENGYDDIDISVHCDVEIFEWLMTYIHEPETPPVLERSTVVSILISSEFLQMEKLVETCIEHISVHLNDIIKLPIDLSCVSDRLINKLAPLTHPKILASTRDRKDKILNKLYKRRVELDFSRKNQLRNGLKSIASTLTCCKYCGIIFLDNYISSLVCPKAPLVVEYRGRLVRRHSSISNWSLTAYLKALHAGGMTWEAIYWHVWGGCVVLRAGDNAFSALESDAYTLDADGVEYSGGAAAEWTSSSSIASGALLPYSQQITSSSDNLPFSLNYENDCNSIKAKPLKIPISNSEDSMWNCAVAESKGDATINSKDAVGSLPTSSLNPQRPAEVLTGEIFDLLCMQSKSISGGQHKKLIESTCIDITSNITNFENPLKFDYSLLLWTDVDKNLVLDSEETRGRSRSPNGGGNRKATHSLQSKLRYASSNDDDNVDDVSRASRALRSSSMGARQSKLHKYSKGSDRSISVEKRATCGEGGLVGGSDWHIDILRSLPAEVAKRAVHSKGCVNGIWLVEHPLATHSFSQMDMLQTIRDTASLSNSKKLEWQLDVVREYDEKRMDRFESFLLAKRVDNNDVQLRSGANANPSTFSRYQKILNEKIKNSLLSNTVTNPYYKDKGKQPQKDKYHLVERL